MGNLIPIRYLEELAWFVPVDTTPCYHIAVGQVRGYHHTANSKYQLLNVRLMITTWVKEHSSGNVYAWDGISVFDPYGKMLEQNSGISTALQFRTYLVFEQPSDCAAFVLSNPDIMNLNIGWRKYEDCLTVSRELGFPV